MDDEAVVIQAQATPTPTPALRRAVGRLAGDRLLEEDTRLWRGAGDRQALLQAIDFSLRYLRTKRAAAAYSRQYPRTRISRKRVERSLRRFSALLKAARTAADLRRAVEREFVFYDPLTRRTSGSTAAATAIHFTGYYEPIYNASRTRNATYRYPLFRLPSQFRHWPRPHPTRAALEGRTGLEFSNQLRGMELLWLRDRLEAYLVQVQGSARLRLTDGTIMSIGYAGTTAWPYTSMGRELVKDGKIPFEKLTLPTVIEYFQRTPQELNRYLPRNRRFVFFRPTHGAAVRGGLGVPLTAERSIATDKSIMPPGALAIAQIQFSNPYAAQVMGTKAMTRYVLDQDAGAAIKGAARVDLFTGTGSHAGRRAGVINSTGRLYYLLLKND